VRRFLKQHIDLASGNITYTGYAIGELGGEMLADRDPNVGPAEEYRFSRTGRVYEQAWCKEGVSYRPDGPGEIHYFSDKVRTCYSEGGKEICRESEANPASAYGPDLHLPPEIFDPEDDPEMRANLTLTIDLDSGIVCETQYRLGGRLHRDEVQGPSRETRHLDTGKIVVREYHRDLALHRLNGPARLTWHADGSSAGEEYFRHGLLHRVSREGPARTTFHIGGRLAGEEYYSEGVLHRDVTEGPAKQHWDNVGNVLNFEYWQRGIQLQRPQLIQRSESSAHLKR
jgi:hypothetical protein